MATSVTLKPNAIDISGSTSGTTTLQASAVAGTTTLTLPAATDTLVGKATTDTLTNKTLTGAAMNGTLGATTPSTASVTTLTTSSTVTHSGGTANGVAYLDGSKVLTTGSALVFDGSNLGVGVTPPTSTDAGNITIKGGSTLNFSTASANIASNATFNSGWKYIATAAAVKYTQSGAEHQWFNAASGTAGNAITFTQAMTLDASGNLIVGGTSPTTSSGYTSLSINNATNSGYVVLQNNGTNKSDWFVSSGTVATLRGVAVPLSFEATGANYVKFETNGSERARIDSSGNLLVGTTSSKSKTTIQGQLSVGQTGSASSAAGIYLYASDTLSDNSFLCRVSNGSGTTTWYIGNQAITTSSDIRLKENVKPSERNALDLLNQWEIIDHTWNDPSDQCENNRNSRGVWTGISAQQVQPVTPWLVNKPIEDVNEDGSINPWTMDFGYAVPLLVKAIQEMKAIIDTQASTITQLQADVAALKGASA